MKRIPILFVLLALVSTATAQQQTASSTDNSAMEQKLRDLEDRVIMLEGELRQLKAQQQKPAESTAAGPVTPPSAPGTQPQAGARRSHWTCGCALSRFLLLRFELAKLALQHDDPVFQVAELLLHGRIVSAARSLLLRRGCAYQSQQDKQDRNTFHTTSS